MLIAASLGGMLTWLAGPSKGLLMIGRQDGFLPPILQRLNKHGVQQNILVAQGVLTTLIALLYAFIPEVSSAYWILSVITTQVYLVVYLLMFVAAMRLRKNRPDQLVGLPRARAVPALLGRHHLEPRGVLHRVSCRPLSSAAAASSSTSSSSVAGSGSSGSGSRS